MIKPHDQPKKSPNKKKMEDFSYTDFKLYYKAIVVNTVWDWDRDMLLDPVEYN